MNVTTNSKCTHTLAQRELKDISPRSLSIDLKLAAAAARIA